MLPVWRPFLDPAHVWLNAMYVPFGRYEDQMPATRYARQAVAFIRAHRDEPFFVQIGFDEPHSPFWFPVEMRGTYDPAVLPDRLVNHYRRIPPRSETPPAHLEGKDFLDWAIAQRNVPE